MAMDFAANLLILVLLSFSSSQTLANCPPSTTPPVGPVPLPPVIGKPPVTVPPVIGKPPITLPPIIGKPPVTVPPVLPPVIGKPPITLPPIIGKPPITLPPVIGKPPITLPPVIVGPPSTPKSKCPTPPVPAASTCPADTLKLGVCLDVLGAAIHIGDPAVGCCALIKGLASIEAAECLCTTIKLKGLLLEVFMPIACELLITCGKTPPVGYTCA